MENKYITMDYEIEVLSPTTVTQPSRISSFEFVLEGKDLYILDIMKMARENERALSYLEKGHLDTNIVEELKRLEIDYKKYIKYKLEYTSSVDPSEIYKKEIYEIVKTAGRPYIPGSSIKGAIRTAITRSLNKEKYYLESLEDFIKRRSNKDNQRSHKKAECDEKAEKNLFGTPNYSPFRFLMISDSELIPFSNLEASEVRILNICNGKLKWKGRRNEDRLQHSLYIVVETIKKGTKIKGTLGMGFIEYFTTQEFAEFKNLDMILEFISKIRGQTSMYINSEIEFYKKYNEKGILNGPINFYQNLQRMKLSDRQFLIQLGFSTGYKSKSVITNIDKAFIQRLKSLGKVRMINDYIFPKTRKLVIRNNRPAEPLGWVKFTLGEQ